MSEQRLSKLQREIIRSLAEKPERLGKKDAGWPYRDLCCEIAEKTGADITPPIFASILPGPTVAGGFRSTFSQSIRNLEKKKLVTLYTKGQGQRVGYVQLTDKGISLNLNKVVKDKKMEVRDTEKEKSQDHQEKTKEREESQESQSQ